MREAWLDPITWDAALAECRARYPLGELKIDGAIWSFLDTDTGDATLLLLPGAMGFADTAFHFVLAFAPQMRVISVSYPDTVTDGDRLVDGLAALLAARGVAAAHVVGGSYSGLVAQRLAARYPQRVASLILANTWAPAPARARWFRPAAWLVAHMPGWLLQRIMAGYMDHFLPSSDPATRFWRGYFADLLPAFTPALVASRLRAFASLDRARKTKHNGHGGSTKGTERTLRTRQDVSEPRPDRCIDPPVLLVDSRGDRLFGATSQRALRRRYPQARVVALDCPGHAAALTHVGMYVLLYRDWMVYEH